jgi:hypothetical protein
MFIPETGLKPIPHKTEVSYLPSYPKIKKPHRAVYNLTVRDIILPFKNLTVGGHGEGILGTLASFLKEARAWIFTVGGS